VISESILDTQPIEWVAH